jgi:hypothetical protein
LRAARTRAGQASLASGLARAFHRAAGELRDERVSGRDEAALAAIVEAFAATDGGYARMARAARADDAAAFGSARDALQSADLATRAALANLAELGYSG